MISKQDLERKMAAGTIRSFQETIPDKQSASTKKISQRKGQKIKEWITLNLGHWAYANRLELWHAGNEKGEFMFDPERKWRLDWAIPSKKIAFEYEGLNSAKSRHTTVKGYTGDTDKYNELQAQGWKLFRYTSLNYKDLLKDLNKLL